MPLVDALLITDDPPAPGLAAAIADTLGPALGAAPGRVWVRLRCLPSAHYAENATPIDGPLPAFLTLTHAHPPQGRALTAEVAAVTQAMALLLGLPAERVHLEYAPAGAGRIAFGGVLVR